MTYLEKFKQDNPDDSLEQDRIPHCCPSVYGYEKDCPCDTGLLSCKDCWNREMPETETTNEREETKMENTVPANYSIRKTKAQLLEEIADLKKELAQMERYKQYEECAGEMAAMRESFEKAGFTREEAFEMVKLMFQTAAKMPKC